MVEPPIVEPIIQVDGDAAELQMPNLIGSGLREAVARLTALELQANPEGDAIRRPDLLTVMGQQPAPGETVKAGDRVTLRSGVRVPDLTGLTAAEARSRIDEIGLLLEASADDAAATASQIPVAGALVAVGTSVSLILPVAGSTSASGAWLTIIVMLVIAAVLIFFWRTFARNQAMLAASIEVRSSLDAGIQRVWSEGNEQQKSVIRVRLTGAAAELSVQGAPAAITEREW
jgi:beta-lactam-binding protein with PASTA domain